MEQNSTGKRNIVINVIAFLIGFIKAFHCKKNGTIQCGKTVCCDGVPVTGTYIITEKRSLYNTDRG